MTLALSAANIDPGSTRPGPGRRAGDTGTSPAGRTIGDWLSLLTLVVCWGSNFALIKVAVATVPPVWIVCLRLWLGFLIMLAVLMLRRETLPRRPSIWLWLAVIAIFTISPFALMAWGTQFIDTGLGGILIGSVPLFVVAFAHLLVPGESLTPTRAAGVLVGFAGVIVLFDPAALADFGGAGNELWAQLAIVGAALCYAALGICARLMPEASPYQKNTGALMIASFLTLPVALATEPAGLGDASVESLLATLAIGVFPTALAGIVMYRLTTRAGPTFVSLSSYLIPVYAFVLGMIAFAEPFRAQSIAALALILAGIGLSEWSRRRSVPAAGRDRGP